MFNWLAKLLKRCPSREIHYFWKVPKEGRVVLTGYTRSSLGLHLVIIPLGKHDSGHHMVPKSSAVDPQHWQELWNEFNKRKTLEWADTPGGVSEAGD